MSTSPEGTPSDADELERFRRDWKNEVLHRRTKPEADQDPLAPSLASLSLNAVDPSPASSPTRTLNDPTRNLPPLPPPHLRTPASAIAVYRDAVEHEQSGRLDGALRLYRRAFQLDDQVDRLYDKSERQRLKSPEQPTTTLPTSPTQATSSTSTSHFPFQVNRHLGASYDHTTPPSESFTANLRARLQDEDPQFEPEEEGRPVILEKLPFEALVLVLRALGQAGDVGSILRFSGVCKKAFIISTEISIWKELCELTYRPPQIPVDTTLADLVRPYGRDWRELYIRKPRLRLDGVYISVCHYLRPGASETLSWIDPIHLITYHRVLRFYRDGTVLSVLSTEHPSTLVPKVNRQLKEKGTQSGFWELTEEGGVLLTDLNPPGVLRAKYTFEMQLELKSTTRGRWNRLDMQNYYSTRLDTGESQPIRLFNQKAYFFSKVRSYPAHG